MGALNSFQAAATIASHKNQVVGCVINGQFVPYAKQRQTTAKLPYWVRKSGGGKLEGKAIRLIWTAHVTDAEIPIYVFERNQARRELVGAYDRSQLAAPVK